MCYKNNNQVQDYFYIFVFASVYLYAVINEHILVAVKIQKNVVVQFILPSDTQMVSKWNMKHIIKSGVLKTNFGNLQFDTEKVLRTMHQWSSVLANKNGQYFSKAKIASAFFIIHNITSIIKLYFLGK